MIHEVGHVVGMFHVEGKEHVMHTPADLECRDVIPSPGEQYHAALMYLQTSGNKSPDWGYRCVSTGLDGRRPRAHATHAVTLPSPKLGRSSYNPLHMSLTAGVRVGPYEILETAGEGGMGDVYRAKDTRLSRDVALKTIKGAFTERFEREAKAISSLNHPNICTLYDVGQHDGSGYLVMEYIDGKPIAGRCPSIKPSRRASRSARRCTPRTRRASSIGT